MEDPKVGAYTNSLGLLTNLVDCGLLVLTIIGAGWILLAMLNARWSSGRGVTVRSRLVLNLVFGDFVLGCVVLHLAASEVPKRETST